MPAFLDKLLKILQGRRGKDMRFLCSHLLSQRGEASQTALAQEIINTYAAMDSIQRIRFYKMLSGEFAPDQKSLHRTPTAYLQNPNKLNFALPSPVVQPTAPQLPPLSNPPP